jgi:hypothetical protein
MLVVGPWLQRLIAPRLRNYEFTRGGFPPGVFVPLTGAFVLFTVYQLLAGLFTGTVICVARNRQGATYEIRSAPQMNWATVTGLFVVSVFTATLAVASFLQWQDQQRGRR